MKKHLLLLLGVVLLAACGSDSPPNPNPEPGPAPDPTPTPVAKDTTHSLIMNIDQNVSASTEQNRLQQSQRKFDRHVTGFYLPEGRSMTVNVTVKTAASDGATPKLVIGTTYRKSGGEGDVRSIALVPGDNIIPATAHLGGLIYIEFISAGNNPTGKITVKFIEAPNSFVRAPFFRAGITKKAAFVDSLNKNTLSLDAVFLSDVSMVVVGVQAAKTYSAGENIDLWLSNLDRLVNKEDEISGIVANDPNPVHRPMAKGNHFGFVEATTGYMFAGDRVMGFTGSAALDRLLTNNQLTNNCWGIAHECGHQHQQGAYKTSGMTESSVNIYSAAVWRMFQNNQINAGHTKYWTRLIDEYFTTPVESRNYYDDLSIGCGTASNQNDQRMLLWEQFHYIFSDRSIQLLHRITREERPSNPTDDDKRLYLMLKMSEITGYDLRAYFNEWGFKIPAYHQKILDTKCSKLAKHPNISTMHLVTPTTIPSWAPIALIGITESKPITDDQPEDGELSIAMYCDYSTSNGTFTDPRDGKKYTYKTYGTKDWFTKNLNWDGYDGTTEASRGTVGLYGTGDPLGKVYGRSYPTYSNAASTTWCPSGWSLPTSADWTNLYNSVKTTYSITSDAELVQALKAGGDRDDVADGLWKKGMGSITFEKSALVGFNILPAGVPQTNGTYGGGEEPGAKASFVESAWWHQVFLSSDNSITRPNRNSQHHGSVRCIRTTPARR